MTSNPRKKSRCFGAMDILDVADSDNTVQINIDTTPTQEFHWHTDYSQTSASTSKRHTGKSVRTTTTHLPLGLSSGTHTSSNSLPTMISLQGYLASSRQDTSRATSMFTTLFLDPNHEAPAEFASASNEDEGTCFPRPLGDHPLMVWKSQRDEFLEEILGSESSEQMAHSNCDKVEGWTGSYFKKISLGDLGLIIQLGHKLGKICQIPAVVSAYEFYHTLAHLSDNTGLHPPLDCYNTFLRIMHEWCHLLNQGYAYFVEEQGFKAYLKEYSDIIPEEKSTCNNHDAAKLANSQGGKGAAATGVGAVVCGRHDMKHPLSVGDLQKGKRYLNMDYFILSMLTCDTPPDLVISYDIACQWHKNFFVRMGKYPAQLRLHQTKGNILYLIPKFHLPAHILKCRNDFSFNFSAKVRQMDGEAPKWGWAVTNALVNSTKEMGPGSRQDTLDDHFDDYNWCKIIILASIICEKYKDTVAARAQHIAEFISYEDTLWVEHLTAVNQWRSMLELAQEEKTENSIEICHDVSPKCVFRACLIDDIKELGAHSTDLQRTRIQQQANRISHKVDAWIEIQKVYMPKTSLLHARDDDRHPPGIEIHPTKIPLYLPLMALRLDAVDPSPKNTIINDEHCLQTYAALDVVSTYLHQHEWKKDPFPLRPEDISGLNSNNNLRSEGHHSLSWIWKTNIQGGEEGLQEALCIEWCKSRARAQHWQEECELLVEEIRCVKVTFQFYEKVWKDRAERVDLSSARAYTLKQAALWQELEKSAAEQWSSTLMSLPPLPHEVPDPTLNLDSPRHTLASLF
ncbi:hypothetical protein EDD18DRAFT_1107274 [Armillaria luteobubalina]|uniref:CxC2-like cysteine cluster KDZ transposase-associated domain-containing protein n=1 Tax=Armillaria luteobubalina TaxID=153913 RepID=A0AA39ULH1_9AGAR|nr:hypothetical protein EDD18DRAFT_1107274 [Armillaria luteobubalina]